MTLAFPHTDFYQNFSSPALPIAASLQYPHGPKPDFHTPSPPFYEYLGNSFSESPPQLHSYSLIRQLFVKVWQKTSAVAYAFLHSPCAQGLISGSGASLATKNPLPVLFGLSGCLPSAVAQPTTQDAVVSFRLSTRNSLPKISIKNLSDSNFIVVWMDEENETLTLYGLLIDSCGKELKDHSSVYTYTKGFKVNTRTTVLQEVPSIATFNNGHFVVIWHGNDLKNNEERTYGQLFNTDGAKVGDEFLANTNITGTTSIAALDPDRFIMASAKMKGGSQEIFGQLFFENGTTIGNEFQVNTAIVNDQRDPSVAIFSNGNFVITWTDANEIKYQMFNRTGFHVGNEIVVLSDSTTEVNHPLIVTLNNSRFVVTWTEAIDTETYALYGRLLGEPKMNGRFQINTKPADGEQLHALASLQDGNFVVTWSTPTRLFVQLFQGDGVKIEEALSIDMQNAYDFQTIPAVASVGRTIFAVVFKTHLSSEGGGGGGWRLGCNIYHNYSISELPCRGRASLIIGIIICATLIPLGIYGMVLEDRSEGKEGEELDCEKSVTPTENDPESAEASETELSDIAAAGDSDNLDVPQIEEE